MSYDEFLSCHNIEDLIDDHITVDPKEYKETLTEVLENLREQRNYLAALSSRFEYEISEMGDDETDLSLWDASENLSSAITFLSDEVLGYLEESIKFLT